jgi:hypothetical protein
MPGQGLHPRNTEKGKEANNSQVANTEQLDVSTFQRYPWALGIHSSLMILAGVDHASNVERQSPRLLNN